MVESPLNNTRGNESYVWIFFKLNRIRPSAFVGNGQFYFIILKDIKLLLPYGTWSENTHIFVDSCRAFFPLPGQQYRLPQLS